MHIYTKDPMMINLKTFLKTLFEKYKRIVLAKSTRTLECLNNLNKFNIHVDFMTFENTISKISF